MRRRVWGLATGVWLIGTGLATAQSPLAPFRDDLFRYPEPVASQDGGALIDVPYDEARDIDRRDEIPERRVRRAYVDLAPGRATEMIYETLDGPVRGALVGQGARAQLIVVFMHGRNGDRRLGMNDWTFGGNFNRLKNLVTRAGGLYATLDGGALDDADAKRFAAAVEEIANRSPEAPLVLACGSMGGLLCWRALGDTTLARRTTGLVLLGSSSSSSALETMLKGRNGKPLPIVLAQGSRDRVYPFDAQKRFYEAVRDGGAYPIRLIGFDGGNHGTPIRMIDWRDTLNWILTRR